MKNKPKSTEERVSTTTTTHTTPGHTHDNSHAQPQSTNTRSSYTLRTGVTHPSFTKKSPRRVIFPDMYKTSSSGSPSLNYSNRSDSITKGLSHSNSYVRSSSSISSSSSKHSTTTDGTETIVTTTTTTTTTASPTSINVENSYDDTTTLPSHSNNLVNLSSSPIDPKSLPNKHDVARLQSSPSIAKGADSIGSISTGTPSSSTMKTGPSPQSTESKLHNGNNNFTETSSIKILTVK